MDELGGGDDVKSMKSPLDYGAAVAAAEYYSQFPQGVNLDSAMELYSMLACFIFLGFGLGVAGIVLTAESVGRAMPVFKLCARRK